MSSRSKIVCDTLLRTPEEKIVDGLRQMFLRFIFGTMLDSPSPAARYDRFLRQLRADGRTNMYGAVPYLMKAFDLDRETAFRVICHWIDRQVHPEPEAPANKRRKLSNSTV